MKSICIKVTNSMSTKYLLDKLNSFELEDVYFSCKKFKIYKNIIIHYRGKNVLAFYRKIAKMLSYLVIDLYEYAIIKNLIKIEYFYFDSFEQLQIAENTYDDLYEPEERIYNPKIRYNFIYSSFYEHIKTNHSVVLKGFITFRLRKYFETLLKQIDKSVNKYVIEKEYNEFISLLRMYINSEVSNINIVHLIYNNSKPILLDENKKIINIDESVFSAKFLSDISFSSNDYVLNTLLNLIPKKIYIHLIDNVADEFINTIKLIFENRVILCTDCAICKLYKAKKEQQLS